MSDLLADPGRLATWAADRLRERGIDALCDWPTLDQWAGIELYRSLAQTTDRGWISLGSGPQPIVSRIPAADHGAAFDWIDLLAARPDGDHPETIAWVRVDDIGRIEKDSAGIRPVELGRRLASLLTFDATATARLWSKPPQELTMDRARLRVRHRLSEMLAAAEHVFVHIVLARKPLDVDDIVDRWRNICRQATGGKFGFTADQVGVAETEGLIILVVTHGLIEELQSPQTQETGVTRANSLEPTDTSAAEKPAPGSGVTPGKPLEPAATMEGLLTSLEAQHDAVIGSVARQLVATLPRRLALAANHAGSLHVHPEGREWFIEDLVLFEIDAPSGDVQIDVERPNRLLAKVYPTARDHWQELVDGIRELCSGWLREEQGVLHVPLASLAGFEPLFLAEVSRFSKAWQDRDRQVASSSASWRTPRRVSRAAVCPHSFALFRDSVLVGRPDGAPESLRVHPPGHPALGHARSIDAFDSGWNGCNWAVARDATRQAMANEVEWLYRPVLEHDSWRAVPDFLHRTETGSYVPVSIGSAVQDQAEQRLEIAATLRAMSSDSPTHAEILDLPQGELRSVDLAEELAAVDRLCTQVLDPIASGDSSTTAVRCEECPACPWRETCKEQWRKEDSICLLHGVSGSAAELLMQFGFRTVRDVLSTTATDIADRLAWQRETAEFLYARAAAVLERRPIVVKPPSYPVGRAVVYLVTRHSQEAAFVHAMLRKHHGEEEPHVLVARSPRDEAAAWHGLLELLAREEDPWICVWNDGRPAPYAELFERHGGNRRGMHNLAEYRVDLGVFAGQHFALPAGDESLREVARSLGFEWAGHDPDPVLEYTRWLGTGDEEHLDRLVAEASERVSAMAAVDTALRQTF